MIRLLKVHSFVRPEEITELRPTAWLEDDYLIYTEGLIKGWHLIPTEDLAKVLFP